MGFKKSCIGVAVCDKCGKELVWKNDSDQFGTEFSRSSVASMATMNGWKVSKSGRGPWLCVDCAAKSGKGA